jgi:tetratricopeptide (TPR) repeat protein
MLGECFVSDNKSELGLRQYLKALPKIDAHDRPELFKKCHYMVGRLYETLGKKDEAEESYNEVLAIDYGYKDVLQRLESLQATKEG